MSHIGCVDSEDGTLMLGDAAIVQSWRGSQEEPEHSKAIGDALANARFGLNIEVERHPIIIWSIDGPGIVDVYSQAGDSFCLVRAWFSDDGDTADVDTLCSLPIEANTTLGEITIKSGYLAMIWSAESGSCIHVSHEGHYSLDTRAMMSETSGLIAALSNGIYRCITDEVKIDRAEARRCHLFWTR